MASDPSRSCISVEINRVAIKVFDGIDLVHFFKCNLECIGLFRTSIVLKYTGGEFTNSLLGSRESLALQNLHVYFLRTLRLRTPPR